MQQASTTTATTEKCNRCGAVKDTSSFPRRAGTGKVLRPRMCQACRNAADYEKAKRWSDANPELAKERGREYERRNNEKRKARWHVDPEYREAAGRAAARYRAKNQEKLREKLKVKHRTERKRVLELHGGCCACCGESNWEFLALDHKNGGGNKEREAIGVVAYYRRFRYAREPIPGFRVLCHNCNAALGFYGYCPHQKREAAAA